MHEEILTKVRGHDGVSSIDLAREFLKFKNPDPALAHRAIVGILGKDRRCFYGDDCLWHAAPMPSTGPQAMELRAMPWRTVHVLTGTHGNERTVFHVSAWMVLPTPLPQCNEWFQPVDTLSHEERIGLVSSLDQSYNQQNRTQRLFAVSTLCFEGLPVFLSGRQAAALKQTAAMEGAPISDDVFLISQFFSVAQLPLPRPLTLTACYKALFEREPTITTARSFGEALAGCFGELIERLIDKGIITISDFETALCEAAASFDFSGKSFSYDELMLLPQHPGIYAFKTKTGEYLYIGETTNLRRRIMGYFRPSEESPEKLERLRSEAHFLTTHPCGSELESLIYEYRLIKKHTPLLNSKTEIGERKGDFKPIQDCIILLPHADAEKGMSFWFRRNQKILLKPFNADFQQSEMFLNELESYFFSNKLPAQSTDFPEQEIALRWIKCHSNDLVIVPVYRMKSSQEIYAAMRDYWDEVKKN